MVRWVLTSSKAENRDEGGQKSLKKFLPNGTAVQGANTAGSSCIRSTRNQRAHRP